ncbi:MAG TPA: ribosome silencing factor [Opitutaceae bacterium]|jgi:ribosome-associated protein
MTPEKSKSLDLVKQCCRSLDEKKGGDLRVIDVRSLSSITDFLVIATATSEPHIRALRVELEKVLDASKTHIVGFETRPESGWIVIDAFDVMVHIFTEEKRDSYRLETLWRDGKEIQVSELLSEGKKPPRKVSKARKKATPAKARKRSK